MRATGLMRSHWTWLLVFLTVTSAFDYWDHVTRSGQPFAQEPFAWLAFTIASSASLFVIAFAAAKVLARLRVPVLAADTIGVGMGVAAHLAVTGPLWDRLFWTGNLSFSQIWPPVLAASAIYLFCRIAFGFIARMLSSGPRSRA